MYLCVMLTTFFISCNVVDDSRHFVTSYYILLFCYLSLQPQEFEYEFIASHSSRCPLEEYPFIPVNQIKTSDEIKPASKIDHEIDHESDHKIDREISETFRCPICYDWLVHASALGCGQHYLSSSSFQS